MRYIGECSAQRCSLAGIVARIAPLPLRRGDSPASNGLAHAIVRSRLMSRMNDVRSAAEEFGKTLGFLRCGASNPRRVRC